MKLVKIVLFLFSITISFSQELNYINYTNKNGLPSDEVFGMAMDKKGYLWICTDKGVSKFDGENFQNLTSLNGLKDNVIFNITPDYKNRLWLWNFNMKFNYILNGKIYDYQFNPILKKISKRKYNGVTIGVGKNDKMFFYINGDYIAIDKHGKITLYDKIIFSSEYIITFKGSVLKNEGHKNFPLEQIKNEKWFTNISKTSGDINDCIALIEDKNSFYFIRNKQILILEGTTKKIKTLDDNIISLCIDNRSRIWISSTKDLKIYDNIDAKPKRILENSSGKLIKDNMGNIWFSNSYKGLFKFHNSFVTKYNLTESDILSVFLPYHSSAFLASYNNNHYRYFYNENKVKKIDSRYFDTNSFLSLSQIDYNQNKIEFYGTYYVNWKVNEINIGQIKSIQKKGDKYIISSYDTFFILDSSDLSCKKYSTNLNRLKDIYYLNEENIFLATIDGVYIQNNITKTTKLLVKHPIYSSEHTQIIKRIGDFLLLGTKGKGIAIYSLQSKKIISFYHQENSQLPNSINCIYAQNNKIWVGTNQGIYIYNFKKGLLFFEDILDSSSGLSSNDILSIYHRNNLLYCLTQNEFNIIDLNNKDLFKKSKPNVPEILNIKVNEQRFTNSNSITTDYKNNDFEIYFNSSYLNHKKRITYFYQLSNHEKKWNATKNNNLKYNNLPPGQYVFSIYSALDEGKLKSDVVQIKLVVTQPFWMSLKFKILISFCGLLALFGFISFYFYIKSERVNKKMQIIEYQQQTLRAQIKPHFIFNALNSIQNFVLKKNMNNALDFIEKFSKLTRSILDTSESEYTTLENELIVTKNYLDIEKIRFNNFTFHIIVASEIDANHALVPSLLLQPIVENAIWHGFQNKNEDDKGILQITIHQKSNIFSITIEDNGIGRQASKKGENHNSKGISMLKKRLDLLQLKNVNFEFIDLYADNKPSGTKVIINLPIQYNEKK